MQAAPHTEVKISVIIPVYNVEKYLVECLDSILNQTLKEIEVICVDDASTDSSAQILREYAARDSRIKPIFFEKNTGCSHPRNVAIQQATGKYTYFADADDMLVTNALEKLYDIAETNNADQVLFLMKVIWECENKILSKSYGKIYPKEAVNQVFDGVSLFSKLLGKTFSTAPWSKITRTDLIKEHKITFTEGHIHSDNFFTAKSLVFAKRAIAVNEKFYIRRVREDSITTATDSQAKIRHACGFAAVIGSLQSDIKAGLYNPEQQAILQKFCSHLVSSMMMYATNIPADRRPELLENLAKCPWGENWPFMMTTLYRITDQEKQRRKNMQAALNSRTYRMFLRLTWLPRKIRGGIQCLKDNGLSYTVKHFLGKAAGKFK